MLITDLPLRERKASETRIALLRAALARLPERALEDIPVKELCVDVGISEPTFFKYFASKTDLLPHYTNLFSLRALSAMRAAAEAGDESGVRQLEVFFAEVARAMGEFPGVLPAIIGNRLRLREPPGRVPIPRGDRLLWYGDDDALLELEPRTVPEMIAQGVARAAAQGELPKSVSRPELRRVLLALFFGIPASEDRPERIGATFLSALHAVLRGYGVSGCLFTKDMM